MLEHTFCHIPGIGKSTEKLMWSHGICVWEDWHEQQHGLPIRTINRREIKQILDQSRCALPDDPHFFTKLLPAGELWRLFPHYRDRLAYIDIETTGLSSDSQVTAISLYDGETVKVYVNGKNLEEFPYDVMKYLVLASYNGKTFDIPFLERFFRMRLPQAQIDLRYILSRLGCKGGLKECEKQMGIHRGALASVDGFFAVLLWREYEQYGDERALQTLLAYNIEDTVNLERLLVEAYNRNIAGTPFASSLSLPFPQLPFIPSAPDIECIERIRRKYQQ